MKSFLIFLTSVIILTGCSNLLYYPTSDYYYPPHRFGLNPIENYIESSHKTKIHTWWFKSKNLNSVTKKPKGLIVLFHGNGENSSSHYMQLSWILEDGYDLFIFDYPEYGMSEGKATTKNVVNASIDVLKWLENNTNQQDLIIYGQSMGGITALRALEELKGQIKIKALILDGTFYSYQKIAREKLSEHWLTWLLQPFAYILLSDQYAPKNFNAHQDYPKLVIVGLQDTLVHPHWGKELYEKLPDPKLIWEQPYARHTETFWTEDKKYRIKFLNFLNDLKNN